MFLGLERTFFFIPQDNLSENFMSRIGEMLNMFQMLNHPDIIIKISSENHTSRNKTQNQENHFFIASLQSNCF